MPIRTCALLLACTLLAACAGPDKMSDRRRGQMVICHDGETEVVSNARYLDHTQHGDTPGPCPQEEGED